MSSIPFSILSSQDDNILPKLTIEEHQNFCKLLLKSYQSYERRKSEERQDRNKCKYENEYNENQKKQNQEEIFKWFENLTEYQRIKICTIKNKWLINILIQLYLIYNTYDSCYLKPIIDMEKLFEDHKNFSHGGEESPFGDFYNSSSYKSNNIYQPYDLNFYENFFKIIFKNKNNFDKFNEKEKKKRDIEKNFIDSIKFISLEQDYLDTFTLSRDLLADCSQIKSFLKHFSDNKYFQDWLLPIKDNNIYNFVLPNWMHNNDNLTLFQLIMGYIEQQIILNYEYFYYSKKMYEYSYSYKVIDLYEENKKLIPFVKENYSYHGNSNTEKKELISRLEIRDIIKDIKNDEKIQKKIKNIERIYYYVMSDIFNSENKKCILNKDFDKNIYLDLYDEIIKEGENGVKKIIDHLTFNNFLDVINCKDNVFYILRKKIVDYQCEKIINELTSGNFLSESSNNKKNKNKKKKKKNKNKENNSNNNNNNEIIKNNKENIINKDDKEEDKKIYDNKNTNKIEENNIKEIKEFTIYDNQNINIKEKEKENKNKINLDIKNVIKDDIKINNIEDNNNKSNNFLKNYEKIELKNLNITNSKEILFVNNKELEGKQIINNEEHNSPKKKKIKNKEFFLFTINNNKKKNKKKKKLCSLSAKKNYEIKNTNLIEDKKIIKTNSPLQKKEKEKEKENKISIFDINYNIENKKQKINFNQTKSNSPLSTQQKCLPFNKKINNSPLKENLSISKEISKNTKPTKNNILQMQTSMNISFENKNIKIENKTNNISNNFNNDTNNINNSNNIDNIDNFNNIDNINNTNNTNNNVFNNYPNIPIIPNMYTQYTPSEKFFESLTKEITNYILITNKNVTNLKNIRLKYLAEIENLIKTKLETKYEIKFGHYGSYFTDLSIESSDLDILINYKSKNIENNNDFYKDIISLLNQNESKFEFIRPIFSASVPVIKLQIDIKNEINDIKLKPMPYFEDDNEIEKINFDLTFTQNEQDFQHCQQIVSYINQSLISYPIIKSLLLILKRYLKTMKMNKSFHGGLSSYSLYLLIYTFCKKFPLVISSSGKALYSFLGFFSMFEFEKYGVDVENTNIYYYLNNNYIYNNYYNLEEQNIKKEINIIDPLSKLNVAKSSFKVDEIQDTFRSAYNFLGTEGCYYDYYALINKTGYENNYFGHIKNNYDIDNNDFKTIKKLFGLNKKHHFFDFFGN